MIYKIPTIILVAISVDLKHGEGPHGTVDAGVSGKLDSIWKHFHGCFSAMDAKIEKSSWRLLKTILKMASVCPVMKTPPLSGSALLYQWGRGGGTELHEFYYIDYKEHHKANQVL